jgi:hypothetical protein
MDGQMKPRNAIQQSAQKYFAKTAQAEMVTKAIGKKERSAGAAKIARLKALRLAKEAGDKEEADKLAAQENGATPIAKRKRTPAVKPLKMLRMSY